MDRIIYRSINLKCDPQEAFKMFTVNENLEKWLTQVAEVEPEVGGRYELFWDPEDRENDSTIGCRIQALTHGSLLSFEWKGPKQFKHFMNEARPLTTVTVFFGCHPDGTEVHLVHTGWRDTPEWEEARRWFENAWTEALLALQTYVGKGASVECCQ